MINFVAGIILQVSLKMLETRLTLVLHGLHLYRKIPDAGCSLCTSETLDRPSACTGASVKSGHII
jgi:hypothetical protein